MRSLPHSLGRFEYTVSHTSRSALAYNMLHTCASVNHTMIDMKEPFSAILLLLWMYGNDAMLRKESSTKLSCVFFKITLTDVYLALGCNNCGSTN